MVGVLALNREGLAGIEQTFDEELSGTPGERTVEVGSGGNPIPSGIDESTPMSSRDGARGHRCHRRGPLARTSGERIPPRSHIPADQDRVGRQGAGWPQEGC